MKRILGLTMACFYLGPFSSACSAAERLVFLTQALSLKNMEGKGELRSPKAPAILKAAGRVGALLPLPKATQPILRREWLDIAPVIAFHIPGLEPFWDAVIQSYRLAEKRLLELQRILETGNKDLIAESLAVIAKEARILRLRIQELANQLPPDLKRDLYLPVIGHSVTHAQDSIGLATYTWGIVMKRKNGLQSVRERLEVCLSRVRGVIDSYNHIAQDYRRYMKRGA